VGSQEASLSLIGFLSILREGFPKNTAFVSEVVASRDRRNIYAGNRVTDDTIAVFDVNKKTGILHQVQLANSAAKNARHVALDTSRRWMVISHQVSNDLTVLEQIGRPVSSQLLSILILWTSLCVLCLQNKYFLETGHLSDCRNFGDREHGSVLKLHLQFNEKTVALCAVVSS
jgi:hypothetical protein